MPIYQTEEDLEREEAVARYLMDLFGWDRVEKLNPLDEVDRCIWIGDNIYAWAEIKTRTWALEKFYRAGGKYPGTYMIDVKKVDAGLRAARAWDKHYFLIIGLTDGIFLNQIKRTDHYIQDWGGRVDRNDPEDKDWCYWIPLEEFKRVGQL